MPSAKRLTGELNSPVVEWLNKGLMGVWSPNQDEGGASIDGRKEFSSRKCPCGALGAYVCVGWSAIGGFHMHVNQRVFAF
eukprot:6046139-Pyramimonas_sp.AAC.1